MAFVKIAIATALCALLSVPAVASAADPRPRTGKTVVVERAKGTVYVQKRGSSRRARLSSRAKAIPVGSTVDATRGTVELTSTRNRSGSKLQSAVFYDGAFVVSQRKAARPLTDLELAGGDFSGCAAEKRRTGVFASRTSRRRLWGRGRGRFRTRGRNGSATVRGTTWLTEDECQGTATLNKSGKVLAEAADVDLDRLLDPGQSVIFHCNTEPPAGVSQLYCVLVLSQPATRRQPFDLVAFGIATAGTPYESYALRVRRPDGATSEPEQFPFGPADADGVKAGGVGCVPSSRGAYSVEWSIGGSPLPVPLPFSIRTPFQDAAFCVSDPPRPGDPAPKLSRPSRQARAAARAGE